MEGILDESALTLTNLRATLRIYDDAPDAAQQRCLAEHPFPLKEPARPWQAQFRPLHPPSFSVFGSVHTISRTARNQIATWLSTML